MSLAIRGRDLGVTVDGAELLRDVDLDVEPGEWVSLIGPNGAGKSTLLKVLSGQLMATGTVAIGDLDPREMDRRRIARHIAVVPQRPIAPAGVTVTDYVLLGRTPYIGYLGTESPSDLEIVGDALAQLDLMQLAGRQVSTLSGGEFQRAVLARAIAQQASVLLLDEPTSALDIGHEQRVLELVDLLRRELGLTVVAAIHDLTIASQFCDHMLLIADGRRAAAGAAVDVLTEASIAMHYGASVRVLHADDGTVAVVPARIWTAEDQVPT